MYWLFDIVIWVTVVSILNPSWFTILNCLLSSKSVYNHAPIVYWIDGDRYNPYDKRITRERYDHQEMQSLRKHAVKMGSQAKKFGLILGTLGRQGKPEIMQYLENSIRAAGKECITVLLSEIFPGKLAQFEDVDA